MSIANASSSSVEPRIDVSKDQCGWGCCQAQKARIFIRIAQAFQPENSVLKMAKFGIPDEKINSADSPKVCAQDGLDIRWAIAHHSDRNQLSGGEGYDAFFSVFFSGSFLRGKTESRALPDGRRNTGRMAGGRPRGQSGGISHG
ncbi:MAG: hypothetical protein NTX50_04470 [Candidatus Sumerlaeota bacterium]|nr:hypothetical protein [Candidatus Sumerlaeota bacterium]